MRTAIYIDGFNLYKAVLTRSEFKWLDIHHLFSRIIIPSAEPDSDVTSIKYFTARVKGSLCRNSVSPNRQHQYLLALDKYHGSLVSIIEGSHSHVTTKGQLIEPETSPHFGDWVTIKKMEEKQTDVNIALHMYRDCVQGSYDHVVLVSNDSDLAPAIQLVRNDFPNIICGVVIPSSTRKSRSLTQIAHWSRDGITENELEQSQLPQTIEYKTSSKTKQLHKPKGW